MPDWEKVLMHLDDMRLFADTRVHQIAVPENWGVYSDLCDFIDLVKEEILALLKEQEVKEQCLMKKCVICPHCKNCDVDENGLLKEQKAVKIEVKKINDSGRCGRCPNCLMELNEMDYPNYCGYCGKAVKWE